MKLSVKKTILMLLVFGFCTVIFSQTDDELFIASGDDELFV